MNLKSTSSLYEYCHLIRDLSADVLLPSIWKHTCIVYMYSKLNRPSWETLHSYHPHFMAKINCSYERWQEYMKTSVEESFGAK